MKFLTVALMCIVATASADILTRHLLFIKTLSRSQNYKDYQQPYTYYGVSRCEFPRVKPEIHDLTSVEFCKVTTALCANYNGFSMIDQGPPVSAQE
ncbi:hypothetical protein BGZ82_003632 [Podila clonocystis]|nr:hypothetical protein BGZ82_003632 [Podila clonocystis]